MTSIVQHLFRLYNNKTYWNDLCYFIIANRHKKCDDFVQCVPTKKGHQILYKGYTYVFKSRLQCGAEQWCCSYRQKTGEQLPEWVLIYYMKNSDKEYKCNICELTINTEGKQAQLMEHIKTNHKEVYDLHKENPEATVGFRIEFLQLNVLKDDGDPKTQPVILGEVCEAATEEIAKTVTEKDDANVDMQYLLIPRKKKVKREHESRKRSWVWKYFDKLSSIIFRCNLCNVVLSIKGCNTNNMNRHVRTRHPSVFKTEMARKRDSTDQLTDVGCEVETPYAVKTEEISVGDKEFDESFESPSQKQRRSWIWSYFNRLSGTLAQCKLCNRNISHGGNATGNMNRHMKMIHKDVYVSYVSEQDHPKSKDDKSWVWKVFGNDEDDFYSCKICQFRCLKFTEMDKSVSCILQHLKAEHGVISGDQIITGTDFDNDDN